MPNLSPLPPEVIAYMNAENPRIQEIVSVAWERGTNLKHYSSIDVIETMPGTTLADFGITAIDVRFAKSQFLSIPMGDWGDDEITLEFWDGDLVIQNLFKFSGEGTYVRVYYWLPDAASGGYLGDVFSGYMKMPKNASDSKFSIPVAEGFRAPDLQVPRRIIFPGCQAMFGGLVNPVTGLPYLTTQEQIDRNDCPYNRHLGTAPDYAPINSFGNLNGGVPYTSCPRQQRSDCVARLNDYGSYLAFDVIIEQVPYKSHGNRFVVSTQANDNVLKTPLRVVAGNRFVTPTTLLAHKSEPSDHGFTHAVFAICEGPIQSVSNITMNGERPHDGDIQIRYGEKRQDNSGFSPTGLNYSGTAHLFLGRETGKTIFRADQLSASCEVEGQKIRVFNNPPTTSQVVYTNSRAWWLLEVMSNRRWGLGYDYSTFHLDDWVWLDAWSNETVHSTNEDGSPADIPRTRFDQVIEGRDARELVYDICRAGRYTKPFRHAGKWRVMPLQGESVATVPMFTDGAVYGTPNIIFKDGKSSLTFTQKSTAELVNQIKLTFDNGEHKYYWSEQPIIYQDLIAQLAAGAAVNDSTIRVVEKAFTAFGVTRFPEAVRLARLLLELGEFDQGGVYNNLEVKFTTWFPLGSVLGLHRYKVIRIRSRSIANFREKDTAAPLEYFRVMKMRRTDALECEITAQAYPYQYYVNNENAPADRPHRAQFKPNTLGVRFMGRAMVVGPVGIVGVERSSDHVVVKTFLE